MGIKNFSQVFQPTRKISLADMAGKTIAIDAMTELYRAALGAKHLTELTDVNGNPTLHISVILANILKWQKNDTKQIWVFDHNQSSTSGTFHNLMKVNELAKRGKRKEIAISKINSLKDVINNDPLFSDDEEDDNAANEPDGKAANVSTPDKINSVVFNDTNNLDDTSNTDDIQLLSDVLSKRKNSNTTKDAKVENKIKPNKKTTEEQIHSLEKQSFSATPEMIQDVCIMLDALNIQYIEAPAGFEGEAIATYLNILDMVDAVYSADTDPIAYGAKTLWRYNPRDKEVLEYTSESILKQITTNMTSNILDDIVYTPKSKNTTDKSTTDKSTTDKTKVSKSATHDDFLKIAAILGTDACEKTPKIGAKTVLKKFQQVELTTEQKAALSEFKKLPDYDKIIIHNETKKPFVESNEKELINWLVDVKGFNRVRLDTQFSKLTETKAVKAKASKPKAVKSKDVKSKDIDDELKASKPKAVKSKSKKSE